MRFNLLTPYMKVYEMLGKVIKKGDIVIYESTVYLGCTEEDCVPVLENYSGLKFNKDFFFVGILWSVSILVIK